MKRGCLDNLLFAVLLAAGFGVSAYLSFNYFIRGRSVSTPNLVGKSIAEAKAACSDLGINLIIDENSRRNSDKVPANFIVWQNRTPGTTNLVKRGSAIRVELSAGPLVLRVPELAGQTPRTALLRLGQQNLKLGNLAYVENAKLGIVAEDPPEGTVVAGQTGVSLLVGVQAVPPAYVMPDLIDQPFEQVRPAIESHGLKVSAVKYEAYPGIADGIVIRQFPLRGARVSAREAITVVVSRQDQNGIIEQPAAPVTQ